MFCEFQVSYVINILWVMKYIVTITIKLYTIGMKIFIFLFHAM